MPTATKKKWSHKEIKRMFETEGYCLISTEYKNAHSPLEIICDKGHKVTITWNSFYHNKSRCRLCANNAPPSFSAIKASFDLEDYILLSTRYVNAYAKLDFICPNKSLYNISWEQWKRGQRCGCEKCANNKPIGLDRFKKALEEVGYKYISGKYKNERSLIEVECDAGDPHRYKTCWNYWNKKSRCPYCAGKIVTPKQIKRQIEACDYKLLSAYQKAQNYIWVKCDKQHQYRVTWNNFQQGHRCPKCSHSQSKGEREIVEYLRSKGVYVIERDRKILGGKELDIFMPNRGWVEDNFNGK